MRFFLILSFCLFLSGSLHSQWLTRPRVQNNQNVDKKIISWGYYLGTNSLDFNFDYERLQDDIQVERSLGFNVGFIGNLRLTEYLDLRVEPGLVFTQRNLLYGPDPRFENERDFTREVGSTYIYLPLILKISTARLNNVRPFITVGVATSTNLSSNEDNPDDNFAGQFRTTTNSSFYEFGFGIDFYLFWFKFTPTIKGVFAASDELVRDNNPDSPWTDNINRLGTRGIFLNFTFQ